MFLLAAIALLQQEPIHLVCYGDGIHRRTRVSTGQVSDGFNSATVTTQGQEAEGYADQVNIELIGDTGRIRVPEGVRPPLRYGGEDGWWPLRNIRYNRDEIRAKFVLNFMNQPSVRLDRLTGHISIQGRSGNFSGRCEPYNPSNVRRRF